MSKGKERGIAVLDETDIHNNIKYPSEKQFAQFLLGAKRKNPALEIIYEPEIFECTGDEGEILSTLPDFYVRNTQNPESHGTYIEITSKKLQVKGSPGNGEPGRIKDPKIKQRNIMKRSAPDKRYVVLYRGYLQKLQDVVGINFLE